MRVGLTEKPMSAPPGIKLKNGRVAKSGLYKDATGALVFVHEGTSIEALEQRLHAARVSRG